MDLYLVMSLIGMVMEQAERSATEAFQAEVRAALENLDNMVDGLVLAPWDEGVNLLRQAAVAPSSRRASLVDAARSKFTDVSARRAVPLRVRAAATAISGLAWAHLQEPELARHELLAAQRLADEWYAMESHTAFQTAYADEDDPMWRRLDEAAGFAKAVRLTAEQARTLGADEVPTSPESRAPLAGMHTPSVAPAPTDETCAFLGSLGPSHVGSVWHRLRLVLGAESNEVEWFTEARDQRLLATRHRLLAYQPSELVRGDSAVRFDLPLDECRLLQTGREWQNTYIIVGRRGRAAMHRVDLGPAAHAETVTARLRASLNAAELGVPVLRGS